MTINFDITHTDYIICILYTDHVIRITHTDQVVRKCYTDHVICITHMNQMIHMKSILKISFYMHDAPSNTLGLYIRLSPFLVVQRELAFLNSSYAHGI